MRFRLMVVWIFLTMATATAAMADAPDMPVRSFDRFEFDTATAHGLWVEAAVGYSHANQSSAPM